MMKTLSHWGILVECDTIGSYSPLFRGQQRPAAAVVLTAAGEVLVHQAPKTADVAIVLSKQGGALSDVQSRQVMRARQIALALADGDIEAISLKPVAHNWRFNRNDYVTLEEWQSQNIVSEKHNNKGGHNGSYSIVAR